jgi:tetratricopeptide (TPR) repeat protein
MNDGKGNDDNLGFVGLATSIDFGSVDFDASHADNSISNNQQLLQAEKLFWFGAYEQLYNTDTMVLISEDVRNLGLLLANGQYADALRSPSAQRFFAACSAVKCETVLACVQKTVLETATSVETCVELELIGIAALNLFLQANYTGPSLAEARHYAELADINPHECFRAQLNYNAQETNEAKAPRLTDSKTNAKYQNAVLSELAVDGDWPSQVCQYPYFLLLARAMLMTLANPNQLDWTKQSLLEVDNAKDAAPSEMAQCSRQLVSARIWSARAAVAHGRLLTARKPSATLYKEVDAQYESIVTSLHIGSKKPDVHAATILLERGLAEHHFDRPGQGKQWFLLAKNYSGLQVQVTGAIGKRTKFQQEATAQYLVKATSSVATEEGQFNNGNLSNEQKESELVKRQMIGHSEEEILLDRIRFDDDDENKITHLSVLDQTILLALCLDVKNNNPSDGLTAEEMGAYLARVLDHHEDWMVYATGLLERSWLEFERSHGRERAILQMQALADQHTERLTITQSTRQSIDESAPVQERLKRIHCVVYPPRWSMIQDLADRYANLGVVTSAAELFSEIEMWGDAVDCYKRAGKVHLAESIVRERLQVQETPHMWSALGDLTNDPEHYRKAIEVSKGRYSAAYVALGAYYFEKKDLTMAAENYESALKIRPLMAHVWFRLGTISMQLGDWDTALRSFSEVVQQEPEEAEAWANVAAVHLHNKQPAEAYPALNESLKYNRNNWRVWISKLYTCLDLGKFNEAIQCCNMILNCRGSRQASDGVPELEEKCVRAIVGGALKLFHESRDEPVAMESARRMLSRTYELLNRIASTSDAQPWVFETLVFFHAQIGQDDLVLENLMKEYRLLTSVQGWETNDLQIRKVCGVVSHVCLMLTAQGGREGLTKAKLLARGVVKKIEIVRPDDPTLPAEVKSLNEALNEISEKLQSLE